MLVEGRLIARKNLVKESNKEVTFYSIHTLNGWAAVRFTEDVDTKKILTPGLVRINVYSAKHKTTTTEDGTSYTNKILYANTCENVDSLPEFEQFEQDLLEEKVNAKI